ncbi:MAG: hypothetical protein QXL96_12020 [Ignisphaera sp.]
MEVKYVEVLILSSIITSAIISSAQCTNCKVLSSSNTRIYDNGNWLIVEAYSEVAGYSYYQSGSSSILIHQAVLYSLDLDKNPQFTTSCSLWSQVKNIKITDTYLYYFANDRTATTYYGSAYINNVITYDNSNSQSGLDPVLQYALDTAWNFLTSWAKLPLPSPWGINFLISTLS